MDSSLSRCPRPGIVLIDGGYGNNSSFLKQLEIRKLKYLGGVAKNRKVTRKNESGIDVEMRLDAIAKGLTCQELTAVHLNLEKPRTVWVAVFNARISSLGGERTLAIVMNASSFEEATDIDYLITNIDLSQVSAEWIIQTYSQRNWVEVFYRDAKSWLGWREAQVRDKQKLLRHFVLVCACLYLHSLAKVDRGTAKAMGQ